MTEQRGASLQIDRLTDEDTQILKLGRGMIRGHTCKVLVLEPPTDSSGGAAGPRLPTVEEIRDRVRSRLHHAPRFRKHVKRTPLGLANPVWVDDPEFDIGNHITRLPVEGELSRDELKEVVAGLMAEPLDPRRPLWHLAVVDRIEGGATAIVWRVHHALADGTTLVRLASELLWDSELAGGPAEQPRWRPAASPTDLELLRSGLADRAQRWRGHSPRPPWLRSLSTTEAVVARELRPAGWARRSPSGSLSTTWCCR